MNPIDAVLNNLFNSVVSDIIGGILNDVLVAVGGVISILLILLGVRWIIHVIALRQDLQKAESDNDESEFLKGYERK